MIAVIADDLTGAAEIAGLGWRHGLSVEILKRDETPSAADLVVYDSDSRNCSPREARRRVAQLAVTLRRRHPAWCYKKVDSVLRGNVMVELEAWQAAAGLARCLLAPANPTAGRIIRQGRYFVHGKPLHETDFRNDPRHPRFAAELTALLASRAMKTPNLVSAASILRTRLEPGVTIGAAASFAEVRRLARAVDARMLPAGGADFFRALLLAHGHAPRPAAARRPRHAKGRTLFVCGSTAPAAAEFLRQCRRRDWPVLLMPAGLRRGGRRAVTERAGWEREIVAALAEHPRVVTGIGPPAVKGTSAPRRLGCSLIEVIRRVLPLTRPARVCIEGGATAALLLDAMGWRRLAVAHEFSTGVVALRPDAKWKMELVAKPGSYEWAAELRR
jgi:uncharacterized protein YgbK (DUF1537 family)